MKNSVVNTEIDRKAVNVESGPECDTTGRLADKRCIQIGYASRHARFGIECFRKLGRLGAARSKISEPGRKP